LSRDANEIKPGRLEKPAHVGKRIGQPKAVWDDGCKVVGNDGIANHDGTSFLVDSPRGPDVGSVFRNRAAFDFHHSFIQNSSAAAIEGSVIRERAVYDGDLTCGVVYIAQATTSPGAQQSRRRDVKCQGASLQCQNTDISNAAASIALWVLSRVVEEVRVVDRGVSSSFVHKSTTGTVSRIADDIHSVQFKGASVSDASAVAIARSCRRCAASNCQQRKSEISA
jgi:hypothetical protein